MYVCIFLVTISIRAREEKKKFLKIYMINNPSKFLLHNVFAYSGKILYSIKDKPSLSLLSHLPNASSLSLYSTVCIPTPLSLYIYTHMYLTDLQMHNADGFAEFSGAPAGGGGGANEDDVGPRGRLGAARLGVREDAVVPQGEPPRSPPLAVVSPLVEDPGDAGAGADVRSSGIGVRSAGGEIDGGPSPQQRRLRRPLPDPGALQRYAAQRVHLLHPHRASSSSQTPPRELFVASVNWIHNRCDDLRIQCNSASSTLKFLYLHHMASESDA